jgi:hypothetical protein
MIGSMTALAVLLCAPAAAEAAPPDRTPVNNEPFDVLPNRCGFPIHVGIVADNEYQTVTTVNGATVKKITGKLVESYTNTNTGKTIVKNVSGPTTTTDYPDGSRLFEGTGNNRLLFGPVSQGNVHEPGLVFTSGKVTYMGSGGFVTSFSLHGTQENGCALLEP